jgi:hypothetical protein
VSINLRGKQHATQLDSRLRALVAELKALTELTTLTTLTAGYNAVRQLEVLALRVMDAAQARNATN